MFGGGDQNPVSPLFMRENQLLYNGDSSTQLQLFGNYPSGMDSCLANYHGAEQGCREGGESAGRKNLQISLNDIPPDDSDKPTFILNPDPVSTGLRLSYDDDERNSSVTSASGSLPSLPVFTFLGDNLRSELGRQTEEIDRFLRVQEEQIIKGMREMKQRHAASFLGMVEEAVERKLRQKEAEIENLNRRNRELNLKIKQVSMEVKSWHQRARFNESVVSVLKNNLKQAIAQGANHGREGCGDSEIDDAASFFGGAAPEPPPAPGMGCRACRNGEISVLILPCRHLCLCKDCGGSVNVCPICRTAKTVSVPVFMS